ncbi:hypothetical protein TNCV_2506441 [Trichonephila clavipes]|uniref:Uncharacterized protein n=1 Tax=Trichonephila clavipes TaxID=2585209 RepID=A0A8X6WHP4_TRICX|nr:hypothetical protein TNCV_2506441 [Trichonephila clavipes]
MQACIEKYNYAKYVVVRNLHWALHYQVGDNVTWKILQTYAVWIVSWTISPFMEQTVNIHYLVCRHALMKLVRDPCGRQKPLFSKKRQMQRIRIGEITGHPMRKSAYSSQHQKKLCTNKSQCFMSLKYSTIWTENSV